MNSARKQRIVVLGGGCGALAAVFALTRQKDWKDLYDITVYERGWRLGGKGASGVNENHSFRIEEHGLHVWSGFYENAFWLMRECYKELNRSSDKPLATWQEAFYRHDYGGFKFQQGDNWQNWTSYLPHDSGLPGDAQLRAIEKLERGDEESNAQSQDVNAKTEAETLPTPWEFWKEIIVWAISYLLSAPNIQKKKGSADNTHNWMMDAMYKSKHWLIDSLLSGGAIFLLRIALFSAKKAAADPNAHWKITHILWRFLVRVLQYYVAMKLSKL